MQTKKQVNKYKRHPLRIINKTIQVRFTILISTVVAVSSLSAIGITWYIMQKNYVNIIDSVGYLVPELSNKLQLELFTMNSLFVFLIFASISLAFFLGIWLSGKIAGPLFAFTRAVNRLTKGIDEGFKLRKKDELKDLEVLYENIRSFINKNTE